MAQLKAFVHTNNLMLLVRGGGFLRLLTTALSRILGMNFRD